MKRIILLVAVFTIAFGLDMQAQVSTSLETEKLEKVEYKKGIVKSKKDRYRKRAKRNKRARIAHLKSMRKVAKADGVITKEEKRVIKAEKRKMKRKTVKRRSHAKDVKKRNKLRMTKS